MTVLRKVFNSVMMTTTIVVVLLMLLSGYAYLIKPEHTVLVSFLCYAFPVLALVNLFLIFYWGLKLRWWVLIPVAALLLTLNSVKAWMPINVKNDEAMGKTIKVMTYNVAYFSHEPGRKQNGTRPLLEYIREVDPDIVCMQEVGIGFIQEDRLDPNNKKVLKEYKYFASGQNEQRFSVVCMSKYPILSAHRIPYESLSNSSYIYLIKVGNDTIRLINNHLESNKLNPKEKDQYTDLIRKRESDKITKVAGLLSNKVGNATRIRGTQADSVSQVISRNNKHLIVCGDFNDVPGSYTYRTIRKGLKDTWVEKGNGWGNTFHESFFLFRIDYILHSADIRCVKTAIPRVQYSDHYPVWANFQLL